MKHLAVLIGLLALASCHTEPYGPEHFGPEQALVPGTEARLTFNTGDKYRHPFHVDAVSWSEDGSGIVYAYGPRSTQQGESLGLRCIGAFTCTPTTRDSLDTCAAMLPPEGGGAFWEVCEQGTFHTDSIDVISDPAVSRSGQLLFTQQTQQTGLPLGLGAHYDLWLVDPRVPTVKRLLLRGESLSGIQWNGPGTFYALSPTEVVVGTVGNESTELRSVPGTSGVSSFGVIDGGRTVVTVASDNLVHRVSVADGATAIAALPPLQGAHALDVSCSTTACIVLTVSSTGVLWTIWKIDVATGDVSVARTFETAVRSAKLSPASGRVVIVKGVNLYLLDLIVQ